MEKKIETKKGEITFTNRKTGQKFIFLFVGKVEIENKTVSFKGHFRPKRHDPSLN